MFYVTTKYRCSQEWGERGAKGQIAQRGDAHFMF